MARTLPECPTSCPNPGRTGRRGAVHLRLDITFGLLETLGTAAGLTTDVQLAAYAIEQDAELLSNDADLGRSSGPHRVDPL